MATAAPIEVFLRRERIPYTTFHHPIAYSAQEEAAASHIRGREWAKTVACLIDGEPVLAVLPAPYDVDVEALRALAGGQTARLAREDEVARLYPQCEVGAMSPLGPVYRQRVFVDRRLAADTEIAFSAGTHADAIRMQYADFLDVTRPTLGAFAVPHRH